ncbi:MAG: hypothetical protein HRU18_01495 [Pseudoalteromonas sp.]|uniref:hypothetical protein n=1 Tax=Pseudoalteromonas sp. TaxID=53249 RepID=UPI001DBA6BBF|nr:hypothetical protein [Pseudoalteromonas sp.]NRA76855.1 hypothetical protein [Pseudoalteromonas sp.]
MKKFKINNNVLINMPVTPQQFSEALNFPDGQTGDYYSVIAYSSIYSKVSQQMESIVKAVDEMESFYLVHVILSQLSDDALSPRVSDDDIFSFKVDNNDSVQKELDRLQRNLGLDQLIENVTPELLKYGEYVLRTEIDDGVQSLDMSGNEKRRVRKRKSSSRGVTELCDDVEQGSVVSLTQNGIVEGYLQTNPFNGRVERKQFADFIKFTLGGQRVRVDTKSLVPSATLTDKRFYKMYKSLPKFIRIGKSIIYTYLNKLKELELLEKMAPALKLDAISRGNLVGMNLPDRYNLEDAKKASQHFEETLNKKASIDPTSNDISVANIITTAGKTRIIPLFGDKGSLQNLDYKNEDANGLADETESLRRLILSSIGIPYELVYGSDGDSKGEILKRSAKYTRFLRKIQKCISNGLRDLAFIHLTNKDMKFNKDDISVQFNKNLVDIENLDQIERDEATVSGLSSVLDFINELRDVLGEDKINMAPVAKYMDENMSTLGMHGLVRTEDIKQDDTLGDGEIENEDIVQ